jgi:hypothetical protein
MTGDFGYLLEQAQGELRLVQASLLRPTPASLGQCQTAFERAVANLQGLQTGIEHHFAPPNLLASIEAFRNDLRRSQILLESAAGLYFGALRVEIAAAGLYDHRAAPAVPDDDHSLSLLG